MDLLLNWVFSEDMQRVTSQVWDLKGTTSSLTTTRLFEQFVDKLSIDKSNIALLKRTRNKLNRNEHASVHLLKLIDILIHIFQTNDDTIARLRKQNIQINKKYKTEIRKHKITQISLRELMTIPFTLTR
jgi:hypothetical protein